MSQQAEQKRTSPLYRVSEGVIGVQGRETSVGLDRLVFGTNRKLRGRRRVCWGTIQIDLAVAGLGFYLGTVETLLLGC